MANLKTYANRGMKLLWSNTCDIKRSPGDVAGFDTPTHLYNALDCSQVFEIAEEDKERGFLATASVPLMVYVDLNDEEAIQVHEVIEINNVSYTVIMSKRWPHEDPFYYELIVEYVA